MPAKTRKQQRFMAMCANNPGKAKGKCPPAKVSKEFSHLSSSSRERLKKLGH